MDKVLVTSESMNEEMKDFVGYRKARTPPASPIAMLPAWANTVEMGVLLMNIFIVLLGVLISFTMVDVSSPDGSSIMAFFGKKC
tara:strand:- start:104 stop:355 length:252 start_codon:yes stop_codon:yes gene_type:complete